MHIEDRHVFAYESENDRPHYFLQAFSIILFYYLISCFVSRFGSLITDSGHWSLRLYYPFYSYLLFISQEGIVFCVACTMNAMTMTVGRHCLSFNSFVFHARLSNNSKCFTKYESGCWYWYNCFTFSIRLMYFVWPSATIPTSLFLTFDAN